MASAENLLADLDIEDSEPVDISHHYSDVTNRRHETFIKGFYKYFRIPGIGNLGGGLPNYQYFPFDTLEASTALPSRSNPSSKEPTEASPPTSSIKFRHDAPASRVLVPKTSKTEDVLHQIDVKSALQYGTSQGYRPLYTYVRQFALENMNPNVPYRNGPEIIISAGATDGFSKTIEALSNAWSERDPVDRREGMLVEEFSFTMPLQAARARGINIVPVAIDEEGMCADGPGGLVDVMESWDPRNGKRPHLIYTITVGQNPTSGVLSIERRKAIYDVCVRYDILIIEDDPYWFLQYPSALEKPHLNDQSSQNSTEPPVKTTPEPPPSNSKSSGYDFLDSLVPSYLSVDYQGRVIRLDTFSKTVAPGCRLGWITAQPALCERLLRITDAFAQQPSGFVQSMIAELIMGPQTDKSGKGGGKDGNGWKTDGWVRWLEGLRGRYEWRMNVMCKVLDQGKDIVTTTPAPTAGEVIRDQYIDEEDETSPDYLHLTKTRIYDFTWPRGGMFLWLHVHFPTHPLWPNFHYRGWRLSKALFIFLTTDEYRVVITPGEIFAATEQIKEKAWQYFRICFAAVDEDVLERMSMSVREGVRDFWAIEDVEVVEDLLRGDEEGEVEGYGLEGLEGGLVGMGC